MSKKNCNWNASSLRYILSQTPAVLCVGPLCFMSWLLLFVWLTGRGANYCDQFVCLTVWLSVCLLAYINNKMFKLHQSFAHIACGRLLGPPLMTTQCTSGLVDDVMFARDSLTQTTECGVCSVNDQDEAPGAKSDVYDCLVCAWILLYIHEWCFSADVYVATWPMRTIERENHMMTIATSRQATLQHAAEFMQRHCILCRTQQECNTISNTVLMLGYSMRSAVVCISKYTSAITRV